MDLLRELHPQALRIAELLRAREERLAIADGATGGLLSAAILTVPGALDFFVGGGVVYSLRARDVLFAQPREAYKGMRGTSEEYALLQARSICTNFEADWGLAESGSVGASKHPTGAPAGRSCAALAGPLGEAVQVLETGSEDRIANMGDFARNALTLLEDCLSGKAQGQ
jgi:PncC family amidohydrolase